MLWVYGILGVFIFLAIVQLVRFLVGLKDRSRVPTGISSAASAGAADFAQRFPPRWGLWMRERAISHLLTLTAPLWMYTILWLLRPHIFGPLYSQYSGWLWTAYIVFVVGLWSFRDTAPSLRKSRMAFYIFVLLLLGGVFIVDRCSDTPVLSGADSTFKSKAVEKQMAEIHVPFTYTFLSLGQEKKVIPPVDGGYSGGVCVSKEGFVVISIQNPVCASLQGVVVHFYNKAGTLLRSETLAPQSVFSVPFDCVRFTRKSPSSGYCPVNVWVRDPDARP